MASTRTSPKKTSGGKKESGTKKESFSPGFYSHLERIREAKSAADKAVPDSLAAAKASLSIAWEAVFDYCCGEGRDASLSGLSSLAGIIHKLVASNIQLKNLESKSASSGGEPKGLDEDTISEIEEKLGLL